MCSVRTGLQGKHQKEFSCANDFKWLASGHTVMLRTTYSERLVFHASSETNYPDQSSVVVFCPSRQTLGLSLPKVA
jgi:hypothetical protein